MQLHAAASRGDVTAMTLALSQGTDINARNAAERTALVFALEQAEGFSHWRGPTVTLEAVQFLLDAGSDLEAADSLGETAIHRAARIPDPQFLDLLLRRGGNPKHITPSGYSVFLSACCQPSGPAKRAIIEQLREADASLDAASTYGEFPLGVCLGFGDFKTLRALIRLGADPTPLHWSELHHAVALEGLAEVERLSPSSTAINSKNLRFELSPWLLALMRGKVEIMQWLAERGADLTQADRSGNTALHLAAEFGRREALSWLLELGADANEGNGDGETALYLAAESNHLSCARVLLGKGADPTRENRFGDQPIHAAHSREIMQLLAETGRVDVNAINGCGDWPLKHAAENNDVECIKWLLDHGAEVDRTSTGATALHAAVAADAREAMEILLERGAYPNAQDVDGWSPLFCAQSREAIHLLLKAKAYPRLTDQAGWTPERWLKDPILVNALRGR